jgi:hypothetical protein
MCLYWELISVQEPLGQKSSNLFEIFLAYGSIKSSLLKIIAPRCQEGKLFYLFKAISKNIPLGNH